MNVYFFTNEYPPNVYGGAGVHVDYLSREMQNFANVSVRCFGSQELKQDSLSVTGVDIPGDMLNGIPKDLSFFFNAFYRCLKFFNPPFSPDIVHCHTWYTHFAGIISKLAYGVPLVVTVHSLEPLRPWKREQIGRGYDVSCWIERQALAYADAIIAVSSGTKQDILHNFPVSESKIHVVPNGIDTSEYRPVDEREKLSAYGINPDKPYVLFVGRITRQKGIIHLVDAIPYLDSGIQAVLCAGAPDTPEIKREMEEHVKSVKEKRSGVIWITEMLSIPDKVRLYSNASVFCCPSVYEPFGIINLEAMACGTPVVATRTGGIPEIIIDGETGLLVPVSMDSGGSPMDPLQFSRDLAAAINRVAADRELRNSMGRKSLSRAASVYSWAKIAKQIHDIYSNLLNTKKDKTQ